MHLSLNREQGLKQYESDLLDQTSWPCDELKFARDSNREPIFGRPSLHYTIRKRALNKLEILTDLYGTSVWHDTGHVWHFTSRYIDDNYLPIGYFCSKVKRKGTKL